MNDKEKLPAKDTKGTKVNIKKIDVIRLFNAFRGQKKNERKINMIEAKTMVQVEEMGNEDIKNLLQRVNYGHLGLSRKGIPYVVPIHYAFDLHDVFIFTTEGKKTEIIDDNPQICLQVEEISDDRNWQSVIVTGEAVRVTDEKAIERAMNFILAENPKLSPALSIHWMDQWIRANVNVVYKITPVITTGRTTVKRLNRAAN